MNSIFSLVSEISLTAANTATIPTGWPAGFEMSRMSDSIQSGNC